MTTTSPMLYNCCSDLIGTIYLLQSTVWPRGGLYTHHIDGEIEAQRYISLTQGQPAMASLHLMSFSCCFSDLCSWHSISSSHTNCTRSDTKKLTALLKDVKQRDQKEVCFKLLSRRTRAQPYPRGML